jgi:acetamidase/formamidase
MITPSFRGGHEVTRLIRVEGAEVGDTVAIHIRDVEVTSMATSTRSMDRTQKRGGSRTVARCSQQSEPTRAGNAATAWTKPRFGRVSTTTALQ